MPNATDTRVIQMQFDNKDFERNVKVSEKTLDKFKQHLDFSKYEKGLNNFQKASKAITFDHLVDNVQKLTDKFTGLGTVSELILSQIRRGIESTARKISGLINDLSFNQISFGKDKFEQMNKNVQTIKAATDETESTVYSVLKRLNKYTDMTSYNFTDMANNIGKFTSVGIDLRNAEKEMEGIANWAARSGAGIQEASRAMYNLSQAMGVGKLLVQDFKSLENAGMATKEFKEQLIQAGLASQNLVLDPKTGVIKTASKFGKQIEVNYQNLRNTLSKGWADQATIEKTLLQYYYEDLDYSGPKIIKLTQEQLDKNKKLFSDKDNQISIEDWVNMEGADQITTEVKEKILSLAEAEGKIVKDGEKNGKAIYKTAKRYGKQISFTIDTVKNSLSAGWFDKNLAGEVGIIESLGESSYKAAQKCLTLTDVFNAWKDQLSTGWMNFWQQIFGELSESMELFSAICDKVGESFSGMMTMLVGDGEDIDGIIGTWAKLGGRSVFWSAIVGEQDGLYEGAYGLLDAFKDVGKMISNGFWLMIKDLYSDKTNGVSDESWLANDAYRAEFFGRRLKEATDKIQKFVQGIKDFMNEVPEGQTKTRFQMVQDIVTGVLSTAIIVYNTISNIIGFFTKLFDQDHLGPAIDDIVEILSYFGQELRKVGKETSEGKGLSYFLNNLLEILTNSGLITAVNNFAEAFKKLIFFILGSDSDQSKTIGFWQTFADKLGKVAEVVSKIATPVIDFFTSLLTTLTSLFKGEIDFDSFVQSIKTSFKTMLNAIFSFTPDFAGSISGIWASIKKVFETGFSKESISELSGKVKTLFDDFKKSIPDNVKTTIKTIYTNVSGFIIKITDQIKGFFAPFFEEIKNAFTSGFSKESINKLKERFKTIFDSIKNAIPTNIKDSGKGIIAKIKAFFQNLWTNIKKTFTEIFSGKSSKSVKELTGSSKGGGIAKITENAIGSQLDATKELGIFDKIIAWIKENFEKVKSYISGILNANDPNSIVGKIKTFVNNIIHGGDGKLPENNKSIFDKTIDWLKDKVEKVKSFIQRIVGNGEGDGATLMKFLENINFSRILLVLVGALGIVKIVKTVKSLVKLAKQVIGITETIVNIPNEFNKALRGGGEKPENKADSILKIAIAIGIVAAALILVGNMHWSAALLGLAVIGLIMVGLTIMVNQLKKTFKDIKDLQSFKTGIFAILAIAMAIALIATALIPLGNLEWDDLAKVGLGLITIIASLWVVSKMISKGGAFKWEDTVGLIALAAAIWLLIKTMMPFKNIKDPADWGRIFGSLTVVLAIMAGFIFLVAKITKKFGTNGMAGLAQLAAVVAAIGILVIALKGLAKYKWEELAKMVAFLGVVLLELAGFVFLIAAISKIGGMSGSAMGQLAAVAAAIAILVVALMPIALLKKEQIDQIESTLATIMVLFVVFIAAVIGINKLFGSSLSGSGMVNLLAVAGSVVLIVLAMLPLALLRPEQLEQALYGVVTIMTALGVFIILANKIGGGLKGSGVVQLLAVAGAVVMLVLAMIPLALMDLPSLLQAVGAVGALMLGMIFMVQAISKLKVGKQALTNIALMAILMIGLVAVITVFTDAIVKVKNVKWEVIATFATALTALIVGMAGAMLILSKIKDPIGLMKVLAVMIVALGALLLVIAALIPIIMNAISSGLEMAMSKLTLVSGMFSTFADGMNNVSEDDLDAAKRKFEMFMAILAVVAGAGGYIDDINSFEMAMLKLGNAVSQFTFSTKNVESPESNTGIAFIKEILSLKEGLNGFSVGTFNTDVAELGEAIANFGTSTSSSSDQIETAIGLIERLSTQAANLDILTKLDLNSLNQNIAGLGGALSIYAEGAKDAGGLDKSEIPDISKAVNLMHSVMESLGADGGFSEIPSLPTEESLGDFGVQLAALAGALTKFAKSSEDLGDTTQAIELLKFLMYLKGFLTDENIKVANVFGDNGLSASSLTQFGNEIGALGTSLKRFADNTKDFTRNQNVEDALTFFADLKERLTVSSLAPILSFSQAGVDSDALTRFGTEIGELGEALSKFAANVNFSDDTESRFKSAIVALDDMSKLANSLPVIGGIAGIINGNVLSLSAMAGDIRTLGEALGQFSEVLSGGEKGYKFDYDIVHDAVSITQSLADIAKTMAMTDSNDIFNAYTYLGRLSEFVTALNELNEDSPEYNGINPIATGLVAFMKSIDDAAAKVGGLKDKTVFESFRNMAEGVSALIKVDPSLDFTKVGSNISKGIKEGILEGESEVVQATIDVVQASIKAAKETSKERSPSRVFAKIGNYMSLGMAKGIDDRRRNATNSAVKLVQATIDSAKEIAKVHSPSEVFIQIGEYLGLGLSIGISNTTNQVAKASEEVANTTINAMRDALGIHSPSDEAMTVADMIALGLINEADAMQGKVSSEYEKLGLAAVEGFKGAAVNSKTGLQPFVPYLMGSERNKLEIPNSVIKQAEAQTKVTLRAMTAKEKQVFEEEQARMLKEQADKNRPWYEQGLNSFLNNSPLGKVFKVFSGKDELDINEIGDDINKMSEDAQKVLDDRAEISRRNRVEERKRELNDEILALKDYEQGLSQFNLSDRFSSSQEMYDYYGTKSVKEMLKKEGLWTAKDDAYEEEIAAKNAEAFVNMLGGAISNAAEKYDPANSPIATMLAGMFTAGAVANELSTDSEKLNLILEATLDSLEDKDLDINPVITPVVDLTKVTAGAKIISDTLGGEYGLNTNGSMTLTLPNMQLFPDTLQQIDYRGEINDIRNEIGYLRDDIQMLSTSMRQMKFVFHSGEVVAAIGPDMDEYLGRQGYYSVRGDIG